MQIKKIFLYNVPYSEDDHHQPLNSPFPTDWEPIKEFDNIYAHLFNFGVSIELSAYYEEIKDVNYARFILNMGQNELHEDIEETYYAWIDGFDLKSQQLKGSIKILYHWDYWRTFIDKIKPLRGVIISRPSFSNDPPQNVPNVIELLGQTVHTFYERQYSRIVWIYMITIVPDESRIFGLQRIAFPVPRDSYTKKFKLNNAKGEFVDAPSFNDVINGTLLTVMKIEAKKLIGCSISSIAPVDYELSTHDPEEDLKITVKYKNISFYTSIVTDDMIENYARTSYAYGGIHKIDFSKFEELMGPSEGSVKGVEELKWWCFPREEVIVEYDNTLYRKYVHLIPAPTLLQAFPFLIYMKNYVSYYSNIKAIEFEGSHVRCGSYKWTYSKSPFGKDEFKQEFDIKYNHHVTHLYKQNDQKDGKDLFQVHISDGSIDFNVPIDEIFVDRLKENERFYFTVYTTASETISPKIYEDPNTKYSAIVISNNEGIWPPYNYNFEEPLSGTPLNNLYLLDNAGYPITKFQQGRDLLSYSIQAVSLNAQMFILFRFNTGGYIENSEFVVNMTPIDLGQDYLNEYILSGEREASNERRFENIVSSLVNLGTTAAIGTLIGGPGGGVVGGLKSIGKTLLVGGVTTGAVGGILGNYQQGQLENRIQNRASFLIREGNDYSWISNGYLIRIARTRFDDYSVEQYNNKVYEYGIDCNEIDKDGLYIYSILENGGPIKLSSLSLEGDMPYDAKLYIRQKLLNGVFLDSALSSPINIVK